MAGIPSNGCAKQLSQRGNAERFWPQDEKDREAKIARFAKEYGFRLRYCRKGLCAIFDSSPNDLKKVCSPKRATPRDQLKQSQKRPVTVSEV
jgi:hypothetical protein